MKKNYLTPKIYTHRFSIKIMAGSGSSNAKLGISPSFNDYEENTIPTEQDYTPFKDELWNNGQ